MIKITLIDRLEFSPSSRRKMIRHCDWCGELKPIAETRWHPQNPFKYFCSAYCKESAREVCRRIDDHYLIKCCDEARTDKADKSTGYTRYKKYGERQAIIAVIIIWATRQITLRNVLNEGVNRDDTD